MKHVNELAKEAEDRLVARIELLESTAGRPELISNLSYFLELTRRFLAGERGDLGEYIDGQFYWSWVETDPEVTAAFSRFAAAAKAVTA